MNKKRNVDSGRKSARPDYIQKTISQNNSGKSRGRFFSPQILIKTGGDYNSCTSAWLCRKQIIPVCRQNRQREGEGSISLRFR